jgi:hypothetical protein
MSSTPVYSKPVLGSQEYIEELFRNRMELSEKILKLRLNHILNPENGRRPYKNSDIHLSLVNWTIEVEAYNRMTRDFAKKSTINPDQIIFYEPPLEDIEYKPCRKIWALLILEQVSGYDHNLLSPTVEQVVKEIMESIYCPIHPSTCYCKMVNIQPKTKVNFTFYEE